MLTLCLLGVGIFVQAQETTDPYLLQSPAEYHVKGTVTPGMKYREYEKLYDPAEYVASYYDAYDPALCASLSIIPGLGQMICHQTGRGFAFLGGAIGGAAMIGAGEGLLMVGLNDDNKGIVAAGATILAVGVVGLLSVEILSVVDAMRMAKVKNMYMQDMKRQSADVSLQLRPCVSTVKIANTQSPTVGMALSLNF